jgi:hypothetical protein
MTLIRWFGAPVLASALWLSAGCAGAPVPVRSQAAAISAVRVARDLGARNTPEAAYHLALADQELDEADVLIEQRRMDAAQRVLERAKVDADLAAALQREADVRARAASAHREIQDRQHQIDGR